MLRSERGKVIAAYVFVGACVALSVIYLIQSIVIAISRS